MASQRKTQWPRGRARETLGTGGQVLHGPATVAVGLALSGTRKVSNGRQSLTAAAYS